ncbi:glycosyltransferase [Sphingomonas sp. J344]|uniref:glycosyltransferase n=1 Tax=Sphingomonas sp. J344 TaxID=2898434 RepID=UPI002151879F|nr:glycosyltransferase [Sphingomonas sp. J344]MCR5871123.1 glycosyltransferase [Sphingomonas sp. J344]
MQMKIVMLCEFFNEELEFQENLLVKYYRRHGHDVTVIASLFESVFDYYEDRAPKGGEHREYQHEGARIIKLPFRFNLLNRVRPYVSIRTILEEAKPDLIFVHDIMPNLPECIAYVKANPQTRMIMDYHADYSNSGKNWVSLKILHGVIRKWYLDRARPYLQKIFPIVPAGFEFLEQVYRVPMHEMELLPLGTDLEYGVAITEAGGGAAVRKRLGIPADAFTVFTGGKLSRNRRTEHLIDAVRRICRDDLHVIIAGAPRPSMSNMPRCSRIGRWVCPMSTSSAGRTRRGCMNIWTRAMSGYSPAASPCCGSRRSGWACRCCSSTDPSRFADTKTHAI